MKKINSKEYEEDLKIFDFNERYNTLISYDLKIHDLSDSESDMIYDFLCSHPELENKVCILSKGTKVEPINTNNFMRNYDNI